MEGGYVLWSSVCWVDAASKDRYVRGRSVRWHGVWSLRACTVLALGMLAWFVQGRYARTTDQVETSQTVLTGKTYITDWY